MKKMIKYCAIFFGVLIVIAVIGQSLGIVKPKKDTPTTEPVVQETPAEAPEAETQTTETITEETPAESSDNRIKFGELLDITENTIEGKNICVLKVKIESSLTKGMTVDQNYYNIEQFVKEAGGDKYDSIDYWAVADMENGSESKVVSFTVPKDTIDKIKSGDLVATQLKDYVEDLYILPSLQ